MSPFKTFYKKQLVVKSKAAQDDTVSQPSKGSSLNITADECDEARVKMRTSDHNQESGLDKLEVTFKHKKAQNQKRKQETPLSDKGILIHSLSDLFRAIEKMEQTKQKVYLRCSYFEIYND